jgi:hypothetical protein
MICNNRLITKILQHMFEMCAGHERERERERERFLFCIKNFVGNKNASGKTS